MFYFVNETFNIQSVFTKKVYNLGKQRHQTFISPVLAVDCGRFQIKKKKRKKEADFTSLPKKQEILDLKYLSKKFYINEGKCGCPLCPKRANFAIIR